VALLDHLKILDFSGLLPGPYATMMLADLGAHVLRVESPSRPDLVRKFPPLDGEDSAVHGHLHRSKQSIALDLKKPESVDIVKRLVQEYDIILEQFRPGVMERLGLGYEDLKEVNPQIIYCSITGYGQTGPYRDRPGHDNNYLSIAGINGYSGRKKEGPSLMGTQIADIAGGSLHSIIGTLAAVIHRERTGEGQWIDISMTDSSFALNAIHGPGYLVGGIEPEPESMQLNGGDFYDYYRTKDGRYFSVGSLEPPFRKLLCEAIGRMDMVNISMSDNSEDVQAFKEAVRTAFLSKTYNEWQDIFSDIEACVEPVLTFAEACEHPQIQAREMIVDVPKKDGGYQKQIACPIKFSAYQPVYKHTGVSLGANTLEILQYLSKL
jgi:alpha-methylacyl-CoA racemase